MNVLFLQRQDCTFHVSSVKNLPATGKVSTIWCYLPTFDTKRTKMLRSAGFVNVLFLSYNELLILRVFEIEIFLHYTYLTLLETIGSQKNLFKILSISHQYEDGTPPN